MEYHTSVPYMLSVVIKPIIKGGIMQSVGILSVLTSAIHYDWCQYA
jgi:hypothetical protein